MSDDDVKDEIPPTDLEHVAPEKGAAGMFISYQDKIEIYYDSPLPHFHRGPNKAYMACTKDRARVPLIALVCEPHLIPRMAAILPYKNIINPNLTQIVEYGKIYWPPARQERFILIYLDNLGKPLLSEKARPAMGWRPDEVSQIVIKPMINILQDFRDKDFTHGAIRPSNMFDGNPVGKPKSIILGDCLSAPASYMQPVLYEPIERAMTDPIARGKGTQADDLYALGVSLTVLLRLNDPLAGLNDDEIIEQKIMQGSYIAVTGKDRFKGEVLELLRGLLHDDPAQRWTLTEVLGWVDGRHLSPKQSFTPKKAARPFSFGHDKFLLAPLLARALPQSPGETKKNLEDTTLTQWIERSLSDDTVTERFEKAVSNAKQTGIGIGYEDRLVCNISMALDPIAPLRYKNMALMGEGIGAALADAMVTKKQLAHFADLFNHNLAANWLTFHQNPNSDISGLHTKFEHCRRVLRSNKIGEGLERAFYMLCPESPCLSETLRAYFIDDPKDLVLAFEDLCKKNNVPQTFLDRHAVAFLLQKDPRVIEPSVYDINTQERHKILLGNLKCLAAIQKRYGIKELPALAKTFGILLPAVVQRYHDRTVREKMKKNIGDFAANGDLQKMALLLDNQDIFKTDFLAFRKAMLEYNNLEKERHGLEKKLESKETFGIETGKEWSAIASSLLAAVIILGVAALFLSKKSFF